MIKPALTIAGCVTVLVLLVGSSVYAQGSPNELYLPDQSQPLWEVGAVGAVFNAPQYPAANRQQSNSLAIPYVVYRGDTLRIGDGAVARAVAVDKKRYELDVSLDASFNAMSAEDGARAGMPDLDYLFEIGPQLKIHLFRDADWAPSHSRFNMDLQARGVFSTDFSHIEHQGYTFEPRFSYRQQGLLGHGSTVTLSMAPSWGDETLLAYFYEVNQEFATTQRPAYDAKGGYLGTTLALGVVFKASHNIKVFVGGNLTFYQGSANRHSPLFKDEITSAWGIGLSWRAYQSQQRVGGR